MSEKLVKSVNSEAIDISAKVLLASSVIVSAFTLVWVICLSNYGLDFTDESFYLVWISKPFNYSVSITQFGFIYHPLYRLLDGNIAALRQANILVTFCLAWGVSDIFLKSVFGNKSLQRASRLVISGAIAITSITSFVFAGTWLSTPSYNSLALQALLIAATGLLLADRKVSRVSIAGWILIGIGGWLAFMAKPTTAAAFGACSGIYLLLARKLCVRLLAVSLITALGLLILSAFAIDGSIFGFIARLQGGVEQVSALGGGHSLAQMLRLDDFFLGERGNHILIASIAVISLTVYFSQVANRALMYSSVVLSIAFALASLMIILGVLHQSLDIGPFQGLLLCAVSFSAILACFFIQPFNGILIIARSQWALAVTLMVFPYAYAFGTNGNYWSVAANAGIFWVLSGLVFLSPFVPTKKLLAILLPLGLAVQLISVSLVNTGLETPYRQPQRLRNNDYKLEIGQPGSTLILSKDFAQYFAEAINVAKKGEFRRGTPMIDLSGQSPGILYSIGASNIGQAWTIGGYPGSDKLAVKKLEKVACEDLATAWLLAEPEGPRKISLDILSSFGANFSTDFQTVGTFDTATGAGGYKEVRAQMILKPIRSVDAAIAACAAMRVPKQ